MYSRIHYHNIYRSVRPMVMYMVMYKLARLLDHAADYTLTGTREIYGTR